MGVKDITVEELRQMDKREGIIFQGCGGDPREWVDGINDMLTESGILLDGTKFSGAFRFQHEELKCLLFEFKDDVKLDMGKLAMWRLQTHDRFGGTWLSDYVPNRLGGFVQQNEEPQRIESKKPDCPLIGQDGSIFHLMGIASRTLKQNGMAEEAQVERHRLLEHFKWNSKKSMAFCYVQKQFTIMIVSCFLFAQNVLSQMHWEFSFQDADVVVHRYRN